MSKYKSGDIVTIKGTEFVVLDIEKGAAKEGKDKLFVLLKEPVESTMFSSDGNDYTKSKLREVVGHWFGEFAADLNNELIFSREISLLTMDGRENYGNVRFLAAPLTFDEYRKYSRYIPKCESGYWLATGDGAPHRVGAKHAMRVYSNGGWHLSNCSLTDAVRPAMWASEELVNQPKDEKPDLSKYSTMALIQELAERAMRDE